MAALAFPSSTAELGRAVVWAAVWDPQRDGQGLEHLLLGARAADSLILGFDDAGRPYRLHYTYAWDEQWQLQTLRLEVTTAQTTRALQLSADGQGRWRDGAGHALPALAGCRDLDLWPTPSTNTLAIRRLGLALQERREIRVVYVAAPALTVTVMRQAYTRLGERQYRYENVDSEYQVDLTVDAEGVVLDYPGLFRRLY
jgi:hypothetical protein